eukprot:TRINITY_DN13955_c0_g1_i1.p1 TRINITY_DN13955_c0_g1~~TRINITY_DN13955_c0_g1_i1.p1  ORF type:complete len:204 (-),score=54.47 TRINITY_DN13955_c0_g1_i1:41-601(-)
MNISCEKLEIREQENKEYKTWKSFKDLFNKIFIKQEDSSYLYSNTSAIVLKDAHKEQKLGLEGTARDQSVQFYEIIKREAKRSKAYRQLISMIHDERMKNSEMTPIEFHLGKNCTGFIDSAVDWTMDMSELEMFTMDLEEHVTGKKIGMNQGEILMHVLEERYYMKKPDNNFEDSHIKCRSTGSFQ